MRRRLVALLCWGYLFLLLALIAAIRTMGDRHWRGTVLLFAPRWPALLPLVVLVPLALWGNRRTLIVLGLSILAGLFPLMGFNIGWHRFTASSDGGMPIRIVAFNLHHLDLKSPDVERFFSDTHPDVVALEEMSQDYNRQLFPRESWHVRQYNELFIASKYPIIAAENHIQDICNKFTLKTPSGQVDFIIVHLSSPHYALKDAVRGIDQGKDELAQNIRERTDQAAYLNQLAGRSTRPLIIAGDFNLLPDSPLFAGHFGDLTDAFESVGTGFGWTYENQWTSVRIDHVLTNSFFTPATFRKGPWLGSLHFPIVADVVLKNP